MKEAVEILETYARANEAVVRVHLSTNKHARDDGAFVPGGRRTLRSIVKVCSSYVIRMQWRKRE